MFEFPDTQAIHSFWDSADYVLIRKLREGAASLTVCAFPGASGPHAAERHPIEAIAISGKSSAAFLVALVVARGCPPNLVDRQRHAQTPIFPLYVWLACEGAHLVRRRSRR
jgi:hypothetical protein